ncbi:hypothetical protein JOQ06_008947 [Pogonophryne albipinna]|uniref:Uncharacterized protein n=1 Tax=Pogonophryne albipinna TaxID=1090488 RepID=A0AAD6FUW0_9TELE|nr:hypothetical protein JOQ06_008947 [Pogonophryne albipinna]
MAAALLLLLQLVSLASASHHYGGTVTYSYKGRNPDGSFRVDFRDRATYVSCQYSSAQTCSTGNCGLVTNQQRGITDRSTNAPQRNRQWCETETVQQRKVPTDKPFQMRSSSCCWIQTRNGVRGSRFQTQVDLGSRSDTGKPNRSPDIAILPLLRVPQDCPRTYKLMSFDPDGDTVRCRYGNIRNIECSACNQPSGFVLDQGSCSLHYDNAIANPSVFGFELVVEDFPQRPISLAYHYGTNNCSTYNSSAYHYGTNNCSTYNSSAYHYGTNNCSTYNSSAYHYGTNNCSTYNFSAYHYATPLNLNLVFIVGCLLAAVGTISAVALYKVRASKVKYQPLPSFEN